MFKNWGGDFCANGIIDGTSDRNTLCDPRVEYAERSVMRNQTPLVPGQPADDVTVHIVLNYFGSRLGRTYCEYEADQDHYREHSERPVFASDPSGRLQHRRRLGA